MNSEKYIGLLGWRLHSLRIADWVNEVGDFATVRLTTSRFRAGNEL